MILAKYSNNLIQLEEKDFQKLFSKGFGQKIDNIFSLDKYESLYLLENKKIEIFQNNKKIIFENLLKKSKINFEKYLVYKNLMKKNHKVKSGLKYGVDFRVYKKGDKIGKNHSKWLVQVFKDNQKINITDFAAKNRVNHATKKKLLLAIVDQEKDITYFETSWTKLT